MRKHSAGCHREGVEDWPGIDIESEGDTFVVTVPDKYHNGHEGPLRPGHREFP